LEGKAKAGKNRVSEKEVNVLLADEGERKGETESLMFRTSGGKPTGREKNEAFLKKGLGAKRVGRGYLHRLTGAERASWGGAWWGC